MNDLIRYCVERFLPLKEHFRINYYPFEIIGIILGSYFEMYDYDIFLGLNQEMCSVLRTPLNNIYYWPHHDNFEENKCIKLGPFKKIINKDSCVFGISLNNELYSWGFTKPVMLGRKVSDTNSINVPTKIELSDVKDVVCGYDYVVALTLNGDVYSWGNNKYNQLGRADQNTDIPGKINIPDVKELYCGHQFTIAITDKNEFFGWGRNDRGQLGLTNHKTFTEPQRVFLSSNVRIKDIVLYDFVAILSESGELYTWGGYGDAQLGLNAGSNIPQLILSKIKKIIYGKHWEAMAITLNHELYGWGDNKSGNLGLGHYNGQITPVKIPLSNVKDIVLSQIHTMAITCDHQLYSWGNNESGQLGLGNCDNYNVPQKVGLFNVRKIFCNVWSSFAITDTNELYSWGFNHHGQLGLGHINNVNVPQKVAISNVKDLFLGGDNLTIIVTYFGDIYYCGNWYSKISSVPKKLIEY